MFHIRTGIRRVPIACAVICAIPHTAAAQRRVDHHSDGAKPPGGITILRGYPEYLGWGSQPDITGGWIARTVKTECPSRNVQVFAMCCYAGGLVDDFQFEQTLSSGSPAYDTFSISTMTSYDRFAYSWGGGPTAFQVGPIETPNFDTQPLDSFTTAFWESARLNPTSGMYDHFGAALNGRNAGPGIAQVFKDPFTDADKNSPQFWSLNAASEAVTWNPPEGRRQFVVMVLPKKTEWPLAAEATQFYRMFRDVYNVPSNHIVVLSAELSAGSRLSCFPNGTIRRPQNRPPGVSHNVGPGSIGEPGSPPAPPCAGAFATCEFCGVYIDATLTEANFTSAIRGELFQQAGTVPGVNDQVALVFIGHGGYKKPAAAIRVPAGPGIYVRLISGGLLSFDETVPIDSDVVPVYSGDPVNDILVMQLAIYTRQPLTGTDIRVIVNGEDVGPPTLETHPGADRDAIDLAGGPAHTYRVTVPLSTLRLATHTMIGITGATTPDPLGDLVAAVHLVGGWQEAILGVSHDCDENGLADHDEIAAGTARDFYETGVGYNPLGDFIPDRCQCTADFNGSGRVTVQDVYDFLFAWTNGLPAADYNGYSGVTVQDIYDFLTDWNAAVFGAPDSRCS